MLFLLLSYYHYEFVVVVFIFVYCRKICRGYDAWREFAGSRSPIGLAWLLYKCAALWRTVNGAFATKIPLVTIHDEEGISSRFRVSMLSRAVESYVKTHSFLPLLFIVIIVVFLSRFLICEHVVVECDLCSGCISFLRPYHLAEASVLTSHLSV